MKKMIVGIHQPNFFPWMGYFDKIKKSDIFIIMDDVQLSDSAYTQRNRVLNSNGEICYVTVPFIKKEYMKKKIKDIEINNDIEWQKRHLNFYKGTYGKFDFYDEIIEFLRPIYEEEYEKLADLNFRAIRMIMEILNIKTKVVPQSSLNYDKNVHKSELVLELCKTVGADMYLSGRGASKYMNLGSFTDSGIEVVYQDFAHPRYEQSLSNEFISGLSMLDVLFNCGIKRTRELFDMVENTI